MFSLPGYIILEEIHENDRLKIYRAHPERERSPVIIKVLKGTDPVDISKLVNEYETTRNLDITGIIKLVRLERVGMSLALIMEDIGAISLRKHLQTCRSNLSAFFSIAIQLVDALGELHQKGVIHRNLKPENILIHPGTEQVKIIDFGIAILLFRKGQKDWMPNTPVETLAYMSPEQIGRMNMAVDQRSDYYSLGVVLYEILTEQLPLQAGNPIQWFHAHIAQRPVYPGEINPTIPPAVSAIIMKLLSKKPGERYQSASGLLADLEECRRQWSRAGVIDPFALGHFDLSDCFQLPHMLYGREKEVEALIDAFKRVCSGQAGLLLLHGYAGTGKTVLIQKTLKPLAAERGYFITGKFDQLRQNTPYAPFIQAFGDLMRQFLTESRESLAAWKRKLLQALGRSGSVITEVIPEVELIVGPQPPVEVLKPREAQTRFRRVFCNFIHVLAKKEHPLVVFLDDLQWADQASLNLIQYVSEDSDSRYLFLIGAYRDNEVIGAHPLLITLEELENKKIPVHHMSLGPLKLTCAGQFIAETLHCAKEKSQPLAEILYWKTGGNPFFLGQLLQTAYEENLLSFNVKDGCFEWDPAAIHEMPMTDDVIKLMLGKLRKLPAETRKVLKLASCLGNTFNLKILAITCEQTPEQTAADLWQLIAEGLVLPQNNTSKSQKVSRPINATVPAVNFEEDRYEFLHDRVQQAAYSLVSEEEKDETHAKIGRLILRNTSQDELDEKIFDIMDHLNRGLELVKDPAERIRLAEYNLLAGKKAKSVTAYSSALNYFKSGMDLLPDQAWDEHYQLSYDLHRERSECEYLCSYFDLAEQLFDLLLVRAKTDLERADIYGIKMALNSGLEKYQEMFQLGIKGLSLLGVSLPKNPGRFAFLKEILLAQWNLRSRKLGDLADLPEMIDPVQKKVIMLLIVQSSAAAFLNPELFILILLKIGNLTIKYGNNEFSAIGYIDYSFFFGSVLEDYKKGREFELVALKLIEKYDHTSASAKGIFYFTIGAFVSYWVEHAKTSVTYLQKGYDYALESGDLLFAGYSLILLIESKYYLGVSLEELYQECKHSYKFIKRKSFLLYQLHIANLMGLTDDLDTHGNREYKEQGHSSVQGKETFFIRNTPLRGMPPTEEDNQESEKDCEQIIITFRLFEIQFAYLYGDFRTALEIAEKSQKNVSILRGYMRFAEYNFYYSLTIAAEYEGFSIKEKRKYWRLLKKNQQRMKKWSNFCPENFLHKYLLVAAEMARLGGQDSAAMSLYDQSIQSARENSYIQNEAIAAELAARFYLEKGRDKIAQVYLTDAWHGYYRWGAARKTQIMQKQYPHVLDGLSKQEDMLDTAILKNTFHFSNVGDRDSTDDLDQYSIRKAMQKLSDETDSESLLKSFLEIAIENAGADKGYIILEIDENLFIEAAKESDMQSAAVITAVPLENSANLSHAIVRYVARSLEPVVLNDVEQAGIFSGDSYIAQSLPKSILCLPLLFQRVPVGVLYLENSLMAGVFTPELLDVLQLLSTQMAYVRKLQSLIEEDPAGAKDEIAKPLIEPLTEREKDVLSLIASGKSNKEIAMVLHLTVNTVKTHIMNIYGKLQVNRRIQAVTRAKELKLLKII